MTAITASDVDLAAFLATLRRWVEIETPTPEGARVNVLVDEVDRLAETLGLHRERIAGRDGIGDTLVVRAPSARNERGATLLAHLDTVHPVGTLAGPLPWREDGDRIYGPGIYDMKSGALMALWAMGLVHRRNGGAGPPVTLVFAPDEETGSDTSRHIIERESRDARAVLTVEPARDGGKVVTARKGVAIFDIAFEGRASHAGARPQAGRSAIREAARAVLALEALSDHERGVTVTVGQIRGGTARNVVPERCWLEVDVRLPDPDAVAPVIAAIEGLTPCDKDVAITVTGGLNRPPFAMTPQSEALFHHARTIAADHGIDLVGMPTGGASDGNFAAALGVPVLDGLGADGNGAHTTGEHIHVSSIAPRTALLANLIATLDEAPLGR